MSKTPSARSRSPCAPQLRAREPFLLYAALLLADKAGRRPAPLTSILTGKPGTGKSQVTLALLWLTAAAT